MTEHSGRGRQSLDCPTVGPSATRSGATRRASRSWACTARPAAPSPSRRGSGRRGSCAPGALGSVSYGAEGLDWFDGMAAMNVTEFGWALAGEDAWPAAHVPGASCVVEEGMRRMGDPDDVTDLLRWLVAGSYRS